MKKIITILTLIFFSSVSFSQSKLPECKATDKIIYHNCYGKKFYGRNGEYYEAEFKNNLPVGEVKFSNGDRYIGEWNNDKNGFHGKGTITFSEGEKYVGEFKNGKRNGQGTFIYKDGSKTVGTFKNDKLEGKGKSFTSNGQLLFEGEYKNDSPNGEGILYLEKGGTFRSKFKNGRPDGIGIETKPDGSTILRQYKDGEYLPFKLRQWKDGKGTFIYADGKKLSVLFKDGKLVILQPEPK